MAVLKHLPLSGLLLFLILPCTGRSDEHEDLREIAKGLESEDEELVRFAYLDLRGMTPAKMGPERRVILNALLKRSRKGDRQAMAWLAEFGPEAKDAIPDMLKLLRNPGKGGASYQMDAGKWLGKIGKPAVPGLLDVLQTKYMTEWGRIAAARGLADIGPDAAGAVPILVRLRMHWDPQVRSAAWEAIHKLGATSVPHLIEALKSDDAFIRGDAVWLLDAIGPPAKKAIPALLPLRADEDRYVRESAAHVITKLSSLGKPPD
jgi:HEAT repeat protein